VLAVRALEPWHLIVLLALGAVSIAVVVAVAAVLMLVLRRR
jgi:hypothetical protein